MPKSFGDVFVLFALKHVPCERQQFLVALGKQSHLIEHAGKSASGIGTTAKTKNEDPIPILVVAHEEAVSVRDVVLEQPRNRQIQLGDEPLSGFVPHSGRGERTDTRLIVRKLIVPGAIEHRVHFYDVGVDRGVFVVGAVKTQYKISSHATSLYCFSEFHGHSTVKPSIL